MMAEVKNCWVKEHGERPSLLVVLLSVLLVLQHRLLLLAAELEDLGEGEEETDHQRL